MLIKLFSVLLVVVIASGCGLKTYKAQSYVMTKPREDIEKGAGNAGYLSGAPQYVEPTKKTRKVYVLEITKAIPESEVKVIEETVNTTSSTKTEKIVAVPQEQNQGNVNSNSSARKIVIPRIDDEPKSAPAASKGPKEDITYTVQKDDTLQKIAKKYYGTYSAWLKIYNTNKEKIKNPNLVKPGTVITLPADK